VDRAGPGYKVIRLRGLSHSDKYGTDPAVFPRRYGRGSVISPPPSAQLNDGGSPEISDLVVDGIECHSLRCHVLFPHQAIE